VINCEKLSTFAFSRISFIHLSLATHVDRYSAHARSHTEAHLVRIAISKKCRLLDSQLVCVSFSSLFPSFSPIHCIMFSLFRPLIFRKQIVTRVETSVFASKARWNARRSGVKWIHKVCSRSVSSNPVACGARRLHAVQDEKEDIVRKGILPEESPSAENHGECTGDACIFILCKLTCLNGEISPEKYSRQKKNILQISRSWKVPLIF